MKTVKKKNRSIYVLLIVGIIALLVWLVWRFIDLYTYPVPPILQGQIEAQQYFISAKVGGRIEQVLVRKGDQVKVGDLIFTLDSPELRAKLQQVKANEAAAGANQQEVDRGSRTQQINAAKEGWMKSKAAAVLAQTTYQRVNALYQEGVLAEQKRDEAKASAESASHMERADYQKYQLTLAGSRDGEKIAAAEQVKMAAGAVAEVEAYLADTLISAHQTGEVTQVAMHNGELAPAGFPVVTIIDMSDAWAVLQVQEHLLPHFTMGTRYLVTIPGLANKQYPFYVSYISAMGDFATQRTTKPGRGYDIRTFEIELRPTQPIDHLRAGMSVQLEIK